MRDPNNIIKSYELDTPPTIIKMDEVPDYNFFDYDLNDDQMLKKYLFSVEKKVIRSSYEYRTYIQFLREYMDMNKCSFYENVNNIDTTKVRIEIHHEPLSLFDICLIVYNKRVAFNESLEEEMLAKEVMYLHYNLMVGLIPLAETVHELVHGQYLFVPTSAVFGKYREFVNRYGDFMTPEQKEVLDKIEEASQIYDFEEAKTILSKQYIYVDMTGAYKIPRTEDVIAMVKDRIRDMVGTNKD